MGSPTNNISPNLPESLRLKMEKFQVKSPVPIHLKGGPFDRGLFGLTCVMCGVGLLGIGHMVWTMARKK